LWHLIPAGAAFALLALVTAVAVALSIRRESLFIAVLGLLGGFATPVLLSTGENRPIPLFAYLFLLNIGLAWVSYRQVWPVLSWLTVIFTALYQWGWVITFLTAGQLSLAMGIFVLFPLVAIAALVLARGGTPASRAASEPFERTALVASALPLVFAVYLAVVPAYAGHPWLLLAFLFVLDAGLAAVTIARHQDLLAAAGAAATVVVMAALFWTGYSPSSGRPIVVFTAVFSLLFTFVPVIAAALQRPLGELGDRTAFTGPLLLFTFAALVRLDPAFASPWLPLGVLLGLVVVIAIRAAVTEHGGLYFAAAFFAIAAQASWSVTHLDLSRLRTAVALYAAYGLVILAAPIVARRAGRPFEPPAGTGIVVIVSLPLLLFLAAGTVAPAALWALALLLALLNAAMFIESAAVGLPPISFVGSVLSWLILGAWWIEASGSVGILASLSVLAGMTLVTLGGYAWAQQRPAAAAGSTAARAGRFRDGMFLGLTGHLFLFLLSLNPAWSIPPWPIFGTLAVLTLATSIASIAIGAGAMHVAGVAAASLVVLGWTIAAAGKAWGLVALLAAAAVSAFAGGGIAVAARRRLMTAAAIAAAVALFIGEGTAIAAAVVAAPFIAIVAGHVVDLSAILAIAAWRRWRYVALGAAAVAWAAALHWQAELLAGTPWTRLLMLAGAMYLVFVAYPLALGRRAQADRDPHFAAVMASAMFFFAARAALEAGHMTWMIGLVPVAESAVLAVLLRQLLSLEAAGERDLGRLALVAGAALAFVTVAIPLQLQHQWITIGWALEGAALAWLFRRIPHRGLFLSALALLTAVFVRLAMNPAIFEYEPRGGLRIFNWYLYTYTLCAAAMILAGGWLSATEDTVTGTIRASRLLPAGAGVLLFIVLNIEIADYFATGPEITFRFGAGVSQDLTYTIGWLVFGMILLGVGIWLRSHAARVAAVMLIAVTTFKCFLYDLRSLEGLYRVASFVGLGVALALVSLALQKFVLARPERTA
jgi:uncharacterized membrane protein